LSPKPATLLPKTQYVAGFGDNVAVFGDIVAVFGDIVAGVDGALRVQDHRGTRVMSSRRGVKKSQVFAMYRIFLSRIKPWRMLVPPNFTPSVSPWNES